MIEFMFFIYVTVFLMIIVLDTFFRFNSEEYRSAITPMDTIENAATWIFWLPNMIISFFK